MNENTTTSCRSSGDGQHQWRCGLAQAVLVCGNCGVLQDVLKATTQSVKAVILATHHHTGDNGKSQSPRITSPARVAQTLAAAGRDNDTIAAGWLHSIIEDTNVIRTYLENSGINSSVVEAVGALTKKPGQSLEDYYAAVRANPIATVVKRACIDDNSGPTRRAALHPAAQKTLEYKYEMQLQFLSGN